MSALNAKEAFRNKERLLLRRGLPVNSNERGNNHPCSSENNGAPAVGDTRPPSLASSTFCDSFDLASTVSDITSKREKMEKISVKHVAIPRLEYYDNLPVDAVAAGSPARLYATPYAQRITAQRSPRDAISASSERNGKTDTKVVREVLTCPSRLLPLSTPYLAEDHKTKTEVVAEGAYHNVYYNTSYRIPDTLEYRQRTGRLMNTDLQGSSIPPSQPSTPSSDSMPSARKGQRRILSWKLLEPYFPDFAHQSLNDEDLVRDVAARLQALIQQVQSDAVEESSQSFGPSAFDFRSIPDAGRLFGLDADIPSYSTALQQAITTAYAQYDALEKGYDTINALTGEVLDASVFPSPDIIQFAHQPLALMAPTRFFVAKGNYADTLSLLRQSAYPLLPERFMFSHGSYARLTAGILLSRFNGVYRLREVLLEGTGNPFPLFPVADLNKSHAVRELNALIRWCVREAVDQRYREDVEAILASAPAELEGAPLGQQGPAPNPPSLPPVEDICVQLYDYSNLSCLPDILWEGQLLGTFQDHVKRCMEDCLQNPLVGERARRLGQTDSRNAHKKRLLCSRRRLFLGNIPSRENNEYYLLGCQPQLTDAERAQLEDTISLSYGYCYAAQHYHFTGSEGSMVHSVLCGKMPEAALYDCMLMIEKLRLALLHSSHHAGASRGPMTVEQLAKQWMNLQSSKKDPKVSVAQEDAFWISMSPVLWSSPTLASQFQSVPSPSGGVPPPPAVGGDERRAEPNLYSVALVLCDFFPAKDVIEKELLCRAVIQDVMEMGVLLRQPQPEEDRNGRRGYNDHIFIEEAGKAMVAVMLEHEALRRHRITPDSPSPPPPLVFEDSVAALLQTNVPVEALFHYERVFYDRVEEVWRMSHLVEVARALYSAEVLDYAADMQETIISANSLDFSEIPPNYVATEPIYRFPPEVQRSVCRLKHLHFKHSYRTTGVASVRSVFESMKKREPEKPLHEVEEYLHHLLLLYFRDHAFPVAHPQYPGQNGILLSQEDLLDALTMVQWFDASSHPALCDQLYVDVYALAALCPLVLGRHLRFYTESSVDSLMPPANPEDIVPASRVVGASVAEAEKARQGSHASIKPGSRVSTKPGSHASTKPGSRAPTIPGSRASTKPGSRASTKPGSHVSDASHNKLQVSAAQANALPPARS